MFCSLYCWLHGRIRDGGERKNEQQKKKRVVGRVVTKSERERLRATVWGQREGPYRLRPGSANKHGGGEVKQQMTVGGRKGEAGFMAPRSHMAERILNLCLWEDERKAFSSWSCGILDLRVDPNNGCKCRFVRTSSCDLDRRGPT